MKAKALTKPRRKRAEPPEPKDFQEYLDMLQQPKWLQQILVAQPGFSALELAKLISDYVVNIQRYNKALDREQTALKIEVKRLRGKQWNDLEDGVKMGLIREFAGYFVKAELDRYEETNVKLRRELQRLQGALERGLCERG